MAEEPVPGVSEANGQQTACQEAITEEWSGQPWERSVPQKEAVRGYSDIPLHRREKK